jgi:hypothetical protein
MQANRTRNQRKSSRPYSNLIREEEFKCVGPNWNETIFIPFVQPVKYTYPSNKPVTEKTRTGIYLGPSMDTPRSISIFSFVSRKRVDSDNFRILKHIPHIWSKIDPQFFKPPDEGPLDDDISGVIAILQPVIRTQNPSSLPATTIAGP